MAVTVGEIMNPELFTLRDTTRCEEALDALLDLGITAAPVVDEQRRPVGVSTLRDLLVGTKTPATSAPALSVGADLSVEEAANLMAESGRHHVVVVGSDGRAVGLVSSYDLMRALIGKPPAFPATFPHRDALLDVTWSDVAPFDLDHVSSAPEGPGVLVLSTGGTRRREADVWVESTAALRPRVTDLLELPQSDIPALAQVLDRKGLRFRCARIDDARKRQRVAERIRERIQRAPYPRDVVPAEGE